MGDTMTIRAARKARLRVRNNENKQHVTGKVRAAREAIQRRFHSGVGKGCVAILDRLRFVCDRNPVTLFRELPGFRAGRSVFPQRQQPSSFMPYAHVRWFESTASSMKFYVESQQQTGWLTPCSVTLIADDRTGLLPEEVLPIVNAMRRSRLTMVELALDFSPLTNVSRSFVLRHGAFGKLHRDLKTRNQIGHWWGARNGPKRVKSYFKDEVGGHRVELMMRSRFLSRYEIMSVYDLHRFASLLPRHHVWFVRFDENRLIERLRRNRFSARKTIEIVRQVRTERRDLSAVLSYVRQDLGLKNTRRLMTPLKANELVVVALQEWAAKWTNAAEQSGNRK